MIFSQAQWAVFRNISLADAERQMQQIKTTFMNGSVGKSTRPWFVLDFTQMFPSDSTMIGFEIETGFVSDRARTEFMSWLWENTDYVTADREGCDVAPVEITFPPVLLANLLNGDNQINAMYDHNATLASNRQFKTVQVTAGNTHGSSVGCHTNISTAAFRNTTASRRSICADFLRSFFSHLSNAKRFALYSRMPYIGDVARMRGGPTGGATSGEQDGARRIEFKMFHTTTNKEQFKNYCLVSGRLAELMDHVINSNLSLEQLNRIGGLHERVFKFLTQDLTNRTVIVQGNTADVTAHIRGLSIESEYVAGSEPMTVNDLFAIPAQQAA